MIGYLPGVFDKLHYGHRNIIKMAQSYCDKLILGVHTDEMVTSYKRKPIENEQCRMNNLKLIIDCDIVLVGSCHLDIIKKYNINIIFHGDDWELESYKKQIRYYEDGLDKLNIEIKILQYTKGISTTDIINNNIPNLTNIECVLFDYDNTLIINNKPMSYALDCVKLLQSNNIKVKIISNNNNYLPSELLSRLLDCGFAFNIDQIVTSLHDILSKIRYLNKNVYVFGNENVINWFKNYINVTSLEQAELIIILFKKEYNFSELINVCTKIKNNTPYIIGNIDKTYPDEKLTIPDTGSLYELIKSSTQQEPIYMCGKPFFEKNLIMDSLGNDNYLFVGDNINTDGKQALNLDIQFIHVNNNNGKISHLGVLIDYFNKNIFKK